jgi:hypothetical protein
MLRADPAVVTPFHIKVMRAVGEAEQKYGSFDLRLEGGTALAAYHLHHRESEDLDFFAGQQIDIRDWMLFLEPRLTGAGFGIRLEREPIMSFATLMISDLMNLEQGPVKVQFARTSPYRLAPLEDAEEGIKVASARDLFRGKLEAVCGRVEPRDFIDLHTIVWREESLGVPVNTEGAILHWRSLVEDLFECDPGLDVPYVAMSVAHGRRRPIVTAFPLRLLKPVTDEDVQNTIELCLDECARLIEQGLGSPWR